MHDFMIPTFDNTGRTVVITGAGNGIGQAAAVQFAHYGANVVVADISMQNAEETVSIIKERGGEATAIAVDISNSASVDAMFDAAIEKYGRLDVLVANAGIGGEVLPLMEQSEEEFMKVINVNLKGAFLSCKAAAKRMIDAGCGGRIIVTASIAAIEGGGFHGPYGAAKGGLITLVRTMAREWVSYGITVNAIMPGLTATAINKLALENTEVRDMLLKNIPMGRMALPEEIASSMLYLATDAAAFITGTTIIADGGATTGG